MPKLKVSIQLVSEAQVPIDLNNRQMTRGYTKAIERFLRKISSHQDFPGTLKSLVVKIEDEYSDFEETLEIGA